MGKCQQRRQLPVYFSRIFPFKWLYMCLGYHCRSSSWFVFPVWWQYTFLFVVSSQTMNSRFNQNQAEFSISVLAVTIKMFPDGDCLLDKVIDIFWQVRSQTLWLEDSQNFVSSYKSNLSDTMRIPVIQRKKYY